MHTKGKGGKLKWAIIAIVVLGVIGAVAGGGEDDEVKDVTSNAKKENTEQSKQEDTSNTEKDTEEAEKTAQEEETVDAPLEIGTEAPLKDWIINVTNVQIVESIAADYGSFSPNDAGNKYVQVFVTVNNNGKEADNFLPTYGIGNDVNAKILYSDGYEFSATNLLGYSNDLHDSTINPLSSQTGEIAFEIPNTIADSTDELLIQFSSGNDVIKFKLR